MDNVILNSYTKISKLNVSRETCNELESLISMINRKNKEINIISREMTNIEQIIKKYQILKKNSKMHNMENLKLLSQRQ